MRGGGPIKSLSDIQMLLMLMAIMIVHFFRLFVRFLNLVRSHLSLTLSRTQMTLAVCEALNPFLTLFLSMAPLRYILLDACKYVASNPQYLTHNQIYLFFPQHCGIIYRWTKQTQGNPSVHQHSIGTQSSYSHYKGILIMIPRTKRARRNNQPSSRSQSNTHNSNLDEEIKKFIMYQIQKAMKQEEDHEVSSSEKKIFRVHPRPFSADKSFRQTHNFRSPPCPASKKQK